MSLFHLIPGTAGFKSMLAALLLVAALPARAEGLADLGQNTHFHGLSFNRAGSALLLLATHHGVFAVTAAGQATLVSEVHDYMGFSADPGDPLTYWGSGHPAAGGNSGVLRSRDGGATWTKVADGLDGPVDFHQMDVSPADPAVIYGNFGGLQVSRDSGETWQQSGALPDRSIGISASAVNADRLFAATETGLMASEDAGQSWQVAAFEGSVVSTVRSGPGGVLFAFVLGRGLVRGDERDLAAWTDIANTFGESIPLHFAIDPANPERLAFASHDGNLLLSEDGGESWRNLAIPPQ